MSKDDFFVSQYVKVTHETHTKYAYYFIGLTFTLLALAIQSASFSEHLGSNIAELVGWVLLLVSGVVGLYRLRRLSSLYYQASKKAKVRTHIERLRELEKEGVNIVDVDHSGPNPVGEVVRGELQSLPQMMQIKEIEYEVAGEFLDRARSKYLRGEGIQNWTFVGGLCALVASRGWAPVLVIVEQLAL